MSPFRASPGFTEEWKHFDFAVADGVATVTFSRPDKLNAMNRKLGEELHHAVQAAERRAGPRRRHHHRGRSLVHS